MDIIREHMVAVRTVQNAFKLVTQLVTQITDLVGLIWQVILQSDPMMLRLGWQADYPQVPGNILLLDFVAHHVPWPSIQAGQLLHAQGRHPGGGHDRERSFILPGRH